MLTGHKSFCDSTQTHKAGSRKRSTIMKTLGNLVVIFLSYSAPGTYSARRDGCRHCAQHFCLALWFLPFWIIATSEKTTGFEKIAWLLAMICLSWFAWVFYFSRITPSNPNDSAIAVRPYLSIDGLLPSRGGFSVKSVLVDRGIQGIGKQSTAL